TRSCSTTTGPIWRGRRRPWASIPRRSCASSVTRPQKSNSSPRPASRVLRRRPAARSRRRSSAMPLARSFLYVPANREKFLDKAMGLPADAFIFDLEDSVPPAEKANARAAIRAYAPKVKDFRVWVRPNALDTEFAEADLDAVIGVDGIAGLFLPKVDSRADVLRWDKLIGDLESARGLAAGSIKLVL